MKAFFFFLKKDDILLEGRPFCGTAYLYTLYLHACLLEIKSNLPLFIKIQKRKKVKEMRESEREKERERPVVVFFCVITTRVTVTTLLKISLFLPNFGIFNMKLDFLANCVCIYIIVIIYIHILNVCIYMTTKNQISGEESQLSLLNYEFKK